VMPTRRGGEVDEPLDPFRPQLDTVCGAVSPPRVPKIEWTRQR
jgi:hypothetical protein